MDDVGWKDDLTDPEFVARGAHDPYRDSRVGYTTSSPIHILIGPGSGPISLFYKITRLPVDKSWSSISSVFITLGNSTVPGHSSLTETETGPKLYFHFFSATINCYVRRPARRPGPSVRNELSFGMAVL